VTKIVNIMSFKQLNIIKLDFDSIIEIFQITLNSSNKISSSKSYKLLCFISLNFHEDEEIRREERKF